MLGRFGPHVDHVHDIADRHYNLGQSRRLCRCAAQRLMVVGKITKLYIEARYLVMRLDGLADAARETGKTSNVRRGLRFCRSM